MNTKTAKRLRRELCYHPSLPRKYKLIGHPTTVTVKDPKTGKDREVKTTVNEVRLDPTDKRADYQNWKREYYASMRN